MATQEKPGLIQGIEALLAARNYGQARKLVEQMLALAPDEPLIWELAIRTFTPLGEIERAHDLCQRLIERLPDKYVGYERMCSVAIAAADDGPDKVAHLPWNTSRDAAFDYAEAMARESLRLFPSNPLSLLYLAIIQGERGANEAAIASADQGLAIYPRFVPLLSMRAKSLIMLGRIEEAKTALTQALEIQPNSVTAHWMSAIAELALNDPAKAHENSAAAVARSPHRESLRLLYDATAEMKDLPPTPPRQSMLPRVALILLLAPVCLAVIIFLGRISPAAVGSFFGAVVVVAMMSRNEPNSTT